MAASGSTPPLMSLRMEFSVLVDFVHFADIICALHPQDPWAISLFFGNKMRVRYARWMRRG
jgi:hypothetical protein